MEPPLPLPQSLVKQKWALGIFGSEYQHPDVTAHQCGHFWKRLSVLSLGVVNLISSDALASDVIPVVLVLQRFLTKETDEDHSIETMNRTLAAAIKKHFTDMQ